MSSRKGTNRSKKKAVAEKTVGEEIIEALAEFTDALEKGDVFKRFRCWQVDSNSPPTEFRPELIQQTRKMLGVSQVLFARFLGVSPKTIRAWEQGSHLPPPTALRFMDEIRRDPSYWTKRLREVAVSERVG